jgi:hypothetical protein
MRSLFPILAAASLTVCSNMPLPAAATATPKATLRAPGTGTVAKPTVTSGAFANGATMPEADAFGCFGGWQHLTGPGLDRCSTEHPELCRYGLRFRRADGTPRSAIATRQGQAPR